MNKHRRLRLLGVLLLQWLSLLGLGYAVLGGVIDWGLFLQQLLLFLVGTSLALLVIYVLHRRKRERLSGAPAMAMVMLLVVMPLGWYFLPQADAGRRGLLWLCLSFIVGGPMYLSDACAYERRQDEQR
ncbi:MAG: hypothetical protein QM820_27265 [Minicystis sp.]